MVETKMAFSEHLPNTTEKLRRNIRAVKQIQLRQIELEQKFYKRLFELEKEFQSAFKKIEEERRAVVTGIKEPAEEECVPHLLHGADKEDLKRLETLWNENNPPVDRERGIPEFWLQTLLNFGPTSELITQDDMFVLMYLKDITVEVESNPSPKFTLNFHFDRNDYFTNTVLRKSYILSMDADEEYPFNYDGPSVVQADGCVIDWKDNMNITKKVVLKKLRNNRTGEVMATNKTVKADSFFNYFEPIPHFEFNEENKALYDLLTADFELGTLIRDQLIPRAVLYYTGEISECETQLTPSNEDETDSDESENSD